MFSITCLFLNACGIGTTGDDDSDDDESSTFVVAVPPAASAFREEQINIRIDITGLPEDDAITGYTINICDGDPDSSGVQCGLGEEATGLDISTADCPPNTGTTWCEIWSITPGANTNPKTYIVNVDAVGAETPITSHDLSINVLPAVNEKTVHVQYRSQLDANQIYFWGWDEANQQETKYLLNNDLTNYVAPFEDDSGNVVSHDYSASLSPLIKQFHNPADEPDVQVCCRFEFNQEQVGGFLGDDPRYDYEMSRDFSVGVNHLGSGYTLVRETMFIFDYFSTPSSRFEQIYQGPDEILRVYLPSWQPWATPDGLYIPDEQNYTRSLTEMQAEGYSAYEGVDFTGSFGTLSIGGSINGLSGTLVLQNEFSDQARKDYFTLSENGPFIFREPLEQNDQYTVSIYEQPSDQTCSVNNGSGTVNNANISDVLISCEDIQSDITSCPNVAGVWNFSVENVNSSCGTESNWTAKVTIVQNSCTLEATWHEQDGYTMSGVTYGNSVVIGQGSFPDDKGTTTALYLLELVSPEKMEGEEEWSWRGSNNDSCSNGSGEVVATKE